MRVTPTKIPDVCLIETEIFKDRRGVFTEFWNAGDFARAGIDAPFVLEYFSQSSAGVLRGLHFQNRHTQGKLVRVLSGEIFDVAVDLRCESETFGHWIGVQLMGESFQALWIPPGFAHGFYVLSKSAELLYKCTDIYAPAFEQTLIWNDPHVGISWPIAANIQPLLSAKDAAGSKWEDLEPFD